MASVNTKKPNNTVSSAKAFASAAVTPANTVSRTSHNVRTFEGSVAYSLSDLEELRRSVLSCMLWEDTFYESGKSIADRISDLVPKIEPEQVVRVAVEARTVMKLRHVPLLVAVEMLKHPLHKKFVRRLLPQIVNRADEMSELLSMYWKDELASSRDVEGNYTSQRAKRKLPMQLIRGIRDSFAKFDDYNITKYLASDKPVNMADVVRIVHPNPKDVKLRANKSDVDMSQVYKSVVDKTARAPETWEVELSAAGREGKKQVFENLLSTEKLPAMALIRNLRGMLESGVSVNLISTGIEQMKVERILPYRFITARRYAGVLENKLEAAMFRCLEGVEKLPGRTILLIDNSGSMGARLSAKSEMTRVEAACGLAILAKEICEDSETLLFDTSTYAYINGSFRPVNAHHGSTYFGQSVNREHNTSKTLRGFALADAVRSVPQGGTQIRQAIDHINSNYEYDRIVVFTDEQSMTLPSSPKGGSKGYIINVASYQNGIGYGPWVHINGFSEGTLAYISEYEKEFK